MNKKNVSLFFLFTVLIFILAEVDRMFCPSYAQGFFCEGMNSFTNFFEYPILSFYILFFLLLPIIFIIPLRPLVFEHWGRFAIFAIPVTLFFTYLLISGGSGSSLGIGGALGVAYFLFFISILYAFYFAISLIIILGSWYESKTNKKSRWWHYALGFLVFFALCASGLLYAVTLLI